MDRSQLNAWQEMTLAIFLTDFFFLDAKDDISNMGKGDWSGVAKKNLPFLFLLSQIIEVMVHSETQGKKEMQILSCCAVDVGGFKFINAVGSKRNWKHVVTEFPKHVD